MPCCAVQAPHWDSAARIRYCRSGTRFAAIGEGGAVALWRQDVEPIGAAGLRYADWVHHVSVTPCHTITNDVTLFRFDVPPGCAA